MQFNASQVHAPVTASEPAAADVQEISGPVEAIDKTRPSDPIRCLAWNIESGGNDPSVIASQLESLSGYDVVCLCEVSPRNFDTYSASKPGFSSIESEKGGADRLQILFDDTRFKLLERKELHDLNNGNHRSPMYVRLREQSTSTEFAVMVNHLARRDGKLRERQAAGIRDWARDQNVGVINIGDFNLDYDFDDQKGNSGFVAIMSDGIFEWVKPTEWICLLYTSPSPRDATLSRMPSSA